MSVNAQQNCNDLFVAPFNFINDTYTKFGFATTSRCPAGKLHTSKHANSAADLLNDRVLPWYEEHSVCLLRILTDRCTEYNGSLETHEYQLYLAIEDIDHTKTKAHHPQTNGICERFHQNHQRRIL